MVHPVVLSVLLLGTTSEVVSQSSGHLYPISGAFINQTDDGSSSAIPLQPSFVFFGREHKQIYVNMNGHMTFNSSWGSFIPESFPLNGSRDIIAVLWTDLDSRENGQVYYNQYTNGIVLQQATQDINEYFPGINFIATSVFVVTWYQVAYFPVTGTRTTVQAVLISGASNSFVLMNYGSIAATNNSVQAGYDTVDSTNYFIIPGSFSDSASGSNSNFRLDSNVNVSGRWAFLVSHDHCEQLECTEYERCGEKDGIYGCFCNEHYSRPNNESYDSSITCHSSSATLSLSRCQLFEAGFHPSALHLKDGSCKGNVHDGRLVFHFNNEDQPCGTVLKSNGTHFMYENSVHGSEGLNLHLDFCCVYPLIEAVSMDVGINPVESILRKKLPFGQGHYHMRMIPYEDADFHIPLTSNINIEMEINQMLYVEVRAEGVDEQQMSTVLDSCWATPDKNASSPFHWDLIIMKCPNPEHDSVKINQNGNSTVARFYFKISSLFPTIYLHCQVHLCLLNINDCATHCDHRSHTIARRDTSYHDTVVLSLGPLVAMKSGISTK